MTTWVALMRGVNVGGKGLLPMKDLVALLEREGIAGARTYIQSGNVVFRSQTGTAASLARRIERAIHADRGFEPKVMVLSAAQLAQAVANVPFAGAADDPQRHRLFFLAAAPHAHDLALLQRLRKNESYVLEGAVFYLHTPDGMGTSRLATQVERALGIPATARNWNTVMKLLNMTQEI